MTDRVEDNDLAKVFYFCRVIFYLNGIDDRFNLFAWSHQDIKTLLNYHFHNEMYPKIMSNTIIDKCSKVVNGSRIENKNFSNLFYYVYESMCLVIDSIIRSTDRSKFGFNLKFYKFYPVYLFYLLFSNKWMKRCFNFILLKRFSLFRMIMHILIKIS